MYLEKIKEKKFSTGARVMVTPFATHDTVSFVGSIRGGSCYARSDEFAKVHAAMLLEGTKKKSKHDIQILLDSIGASLTFAPSTERLIFSGRVRQKHFEALLSLIAEILESPSFPSKELGILKSRGQASLALEAQDTHEQATIALTRLLFTPKHPNWSESTLESKKVLKKITAKELQKYHQKTIDSGSLILSVSGDVVPVKIFSLVEKHFKNLPRQKGTLFSYSKKLPHTAQRTTTPIKEKTNIDYMAGINTGITKVHSDYIPLLLGIQILGVPGFSGRLMNTVREKEGLTYGVYSYLSGFQYGADGYISIWSGFPKEKFAQGRAAILREINSIVKNGPSKEEVRRHCERFTASYKVRLSNSGAFAASVHELAAEKRPLSYIDEFPKQVSKLTEAKVTAMLKKYLIPAKLSEAAAGPVEKDAFAS